MNITTVGTTISIILSIIFLIYGIVVYFQITGMKSHIDELDNMINRMMMEMDDRKEEASSEANPASLNEEPEDTEDTDPSWNSTYTSVD